MVHRVNGKVDRLFVQTGSCFVRLKGITDLPRDGLFELRQSHENYNALYSLALAAAINGYTLGIRTVGEIDPNQYAPVSYMLVDW